MHEPWSVLVVRTSGHREQWAKVTPNRGSGTRYGGYQVIPARGMDLDSTMHRHHSRTTLAHQRPWITGVTVYLGCLMVVEYKGGPVGFSRQLGELSQGTTKSYPRMDYLQQSMHTSTKYV